MPIENDKGESWNGEVEFVNVSISDIQSEGSKISSNGYETDSVSGINIDNKEEDASGMHLGSGQGDVSINSNCYNEYYETNDVEMCTHANLDDDALDYENYYLCQFPFYKPSCKSLELGMTFGNTIYLWKLWHRTHLEVINPWSGWRAMLTKWGAYV